MSERWADYDPPYSPQTDCRCQIVGWSRDPYEPHIPSRPQWEQADDCPVHPLSRVQAIEAAEDRADQVAFDARRERGL